jgi:hypothetical protein
MKPLFGVAVCTHVPVSVEPDVGRGSIIARNPATWGCCYLMTLKLGALSGCTGSNSARVKRFLLLYCSRCICYCVQSSTSTVANSM